MMTTPIAPLGRRRLVHHLDTPFTTVPWPEISAHDQDTILELLCSLLSPIGQHRRIHIKRSRGKRMAKLQLEKPSQDPFAPALSVPRPPKPELCNHVDIGFNAITREFESTFSSKSIADTNQRKPRNFYSMVFVMRGNQSAAFNCHFPRMIAALSHKAGQQHNIRLIGFSNSCSDRLSTCLGISRVSSLAIAKDAPGADALWAFVEDHVPPVDAAWLNSVQDPQYQPTQIISIETTVGVKKMKSSSST